MPPGLRNPRPCPVEFNRDYLQGTGNARQAIEWKLARKNVFAIHREVIEDAAAHPDRPPRRLYDMGCGAGSLVEEALGMGFETWCNDINRAAIDRLAALGARAFHGFTTAELCSGCRSRGSAIFTITGGPAGAACATLSSPKRLCRVSSASRELLECA